MRVPARFSGLVKTVLGAATTAALVWWLIGFAFAPALHLLDERATDLAWRTTASNERERRIILIDIDEASLRQLGPWPWPRNRVAQLSDRLAAEGAALQIFDVVFPTTTEHDAALAVSLEKNHAILAQVFALSADAQASSGQLASAVPAMACQPQLTAATGFIANAPAFGKLPMGHITPTLEPDGSVRRQPALICYQGKAYPALFIAALAQALNTNVAPFETGTGLLGPTWQLPTPSLNKSGLPLDAQGMVRIPWTLDPNAFVSLSAADVIAARVPRSLLLNAWVIVGSTALGLNDRVATPFGSNSAGLLVHAQLMRGVLDGKLPAQPRHAQSLTVLVVVLAAIPLAALSWFRRKPVFITVLTGVLLAVALWFVKAWLLTQQNLWFDWVQPGLYLMLLALCLALFEFARDRLERDRLYKHLASYLPGPVAAALALRDPSDALEAKRSTITVLYADIRNFSVFCETRPPEESAAVLHTFFSMATQLVEDNHGVVESFQGDAVLATWGNATPLAMADQALDTALAIYRESLRLLPQPQPDELAPLALGIGLETGLATVGSFGLARRRTHLAIGHPVTMAQRLQEMTMELSHPILLGEGIAASVGTHRLALQGVFLLDGLKTPSRIYAYPLRDCLA